MRDKRHGYLDVAGVVEKDLLAGWQGASMVGQVELLHARLVCGDVEKVFLLCSVAAFADPALPRIGHPPKRAQTLSRRPRPKIKQHTLSRDLGHKARIGCHDRES